MGVGEGRRDVRSSRHFKQNVCEQGSSFGEVKTSRQSEQVRDSALSSLDPEGGAPPVAMVTGNVADVGKDQS